MAVSPLECGTGDGTERDRSTYEEEGDELWMEEPKANGVEWSGMLCMELPDHVIGDTDSLAVDLTLPPLLSDEVVGRECLSGKTVWLPWGTPDALGLACVRGVGAAGPGEKERLSTPPSVALPNAGSSLKTKCQP